MARIDVKGPITDNTLNALNHNLIELYNMRNVLQTQINDLVLDAGKSDQEVAQARGGHKVLADRLNETEQKIEDKYIETMSQLEKTEQSLDDKKADKGALSQIAQSKRDKDVEIEMKDLSQGVKEAMTGGSVAVVGENSVGEINLKNEAVTREKMSKNYAVNYPYLSDDTFDLDYVWDEGNFIVNREVLNNPYKEGCTLRVERYKTTENNNNLWITQEITQYSDSTKRSNSVRRVLRVNESTLEIGLKGEWKSATIDNNVFIKNHLTDDTFDLNYVWDEGNYVVNELVKNNITNVSGLLEVRRFKTEISGNNVWITQTLTTNSTNETYKRLFLVSETNKEFVYIRDWVNVSTRDALNITNEKIKSVNNLNWAQVENNFDWTVHTVVEYKDDDLIYRESTFDVSDAIPVNEGEIWRIYTRNPGNWTEGVRGVMVDGNGDWIADIPVDEDSYSTTSTFKIPEKVTHIIVNGFYHNAKERHTHVLKLCNFKNVWDKESTGFIKGKKINNSGVIVDTSEKLAVTKDIKVNEGEIYRIANVHSGNGIDFTERGVFLNDSDELVAKIPDNERGSLPYPFNDVIVPKNATKMRVNFYYEMQSRTDTSNSISINKAINAKPIYDNRITNLRNKNVTFYGTSTTWYADWIRMLENSFGFKSSIQGYGGQSTTTVRPDNLTEETKLQSIFDSEPDVLIINSGGNETSETTLGDIDELRKDIGDEDLTSFYGALGYIIKRVLENKPDTLIFVALSQYANYNYNDDPLESNGINRYTTSIAIRDIADYFSLPIINFRHTGLNKYTNDLLFADNIHLSFRGAERIANVAQKELIHVNLISK